MSFDWLEYLDLAQQLTRSTTGPSSREARLRSAISRAYYAAFCKARNHLLKKGPIPNEKKINMHKYVREQFMGSPDKARKKIGADLNRLRTDRNKADYWDIVAGLHGTTERALKQSERIIFKLGTL